MVLAVRCCGWLAVFRLKVLNETLGLTETGDKVYVAKPVAKSGQFEYQFKARALKGARFAFVLIQQGRESEGAQVVYSDKLYKSRAALALSSAAGSLVCTIGQPLEDSCSCPLLNELVPMCRPRMAAVSLFFPQARTPQKDMRAPCCCKKARSS